MNSALRIMRKTEAQKKEVCANTEQVSLPRKLHETEHISMTRDQQLVHQCYDLLLLHESCSWIQPLFQYLTQTSSRQNKQAGSVQCDKLGCKFSNCKTTANSLQ